MAGEWDVQQAKTVLVMKKNIKKKKNFKPKRKQNLNQRYHLISIHGWLKRVIISKYDRNGQISEEDKEWLDYVKECCVYGCAHCQHHHGTITDRAETIYDRCGQQQWHRAPGLMNWWTLSLEDTLKGIFFVFQTSDFIVS